MRETVAQGGSILIIALLLTVLQPAYANGGHVHLGGVFFLLLGGLIFLGGLLTVFYFLLRPSADETDEAPDND